MSIEDDAKAWMQKNKPKGKHIGSKTQRIQLAGTILAGLLQSNSNVSSDVLLMQAFQWADKIIENG